MGSEPSMERTRTLGKVRTAGVLCASGGAGWLANGVVALVLSQPSGAAFAISEVLWIGVVGLVLSGAAPWWLGGIALGTALLGRADFVLAEIHSVSGMTLRFCCRSERRSRRWV